MTEREERIPNYIDYPYDVFIKLRLEFLLICQDEIEAKVMRIIEKAIEDKRKNLYRILVNKTPKGEEVQLPEQIWVAISHTFFLDRLYGTVQSLNTLKAALKSLVDKKLILKREGGNGPYDAQEYTLNKPLIKGKLADLPPLDELNVMTMMKQPRKPRKSRKVVETEGQKLTPSNFDTLENEEEGQTLIPQSINNCLPRGSNFDTKEGQKLPPIPRDIDYYLDDTQREENAHVSDDNAPTLSLSESNSSSSLQEIPEESTPAPSVSDSQNAKQNDTDPKVKQANTVKAPSRASKPVTAKPTRPEIAVEFANDDEQAMWERLGYDEQAFYAQWDTQARRNYADWCSLFTSRPTISQKMFDAAKKWTPTVNAAQKMEQIKDWCFTIDKKTANYPKGYYNTYGVNLWDVVEKSPTWELLQERQEKQKANSPSSGQKSALAQETGITRPELYRPAEDNNPLREASLNRQWIDPKKRNRRVFGNEAS